MFSFLKRNKKEELPESIKKLDIKNGDTVVLSYPHFLSDNGRDNLKKALKQVLEWQGVKVNVILLEDGLTMDVLRPGERKPVLEKA